MTDVSRAEPDGTVEHFAARLRAEAKRWAEAANDGPTLRDQFAMAALGVLEEVSIYGFGEDLTRVAQTAYALADAMLRERAR